MSDPMVILLEGTFQHEGQGRFDSALDVADGILRPPRTVSIVAMSGAHLGFSDAEFLRAAFSQMDSVHEPWKTSQALNPPKDPCSDPDGCRARAIQVITDAASRTGPRQACVVITTQDHILAYLKSVGHTEPSLSPGSMVVLRGNQVGKVVHP